MKEFFILALLSAGGIVAADAAVNAPQIAADVASHPAIGLNVVLAIAAGLFGGFAGLLVGHDRKREPWTRRRIAGELMMSAGGGFLVYAFLYQTMTDPVRVAAVAMLFGIGGSRMLAPMVERAGEIVTNKILPNARNRDEKVQG